MAGNTRGKLKEHFEGIHRNLDWCIHHVNQSLQLLDVQIRSTNLIDDFKGDEVKITEFIENYPLYKAMKSLGVGISTLDELSQDVYEKI